MGWQRGWHQWLVCLCILEVKVADEASCPVGDSGCAARDAAGQDSLKWRGFPYRVTNPKFAKTIYGGTYIEATFRQYGFEGSVDDDDWDVLWTHRGQHSALPQTGLQSRAGQRLVNHCEYFGGAGNKCELANHVRRVVKAFQQSEPEPQHVRHLRSFDLSDMQDVTAWKDLVHSAPEATWILKPCFGGASQGIELLQGQAAVDAYSSGRLQAHTVAQAYVERPYMGFGGRKFHLRLYVLVTSWEPLAIYLYDSGLVFRSRHSYQHDAPRSADRDAFSSISESVEVIPLLELWEHLDSLATASTSSSNVRKRVDAVLRETLGSGVRESFGDFQALEARREVACFDLFGADVILDEDLNPYVMEINTGPDLWVSHRGDVHIVKQESVKKPLIQQVVHWASLRVKTDASSLTAARKIEQVALLNFTRVV